HAGFVYAVAALPDPDADGDVLHFASASEDRTCRLWSVETGACLQALTMPCQSIWAVCWLVNGDLAVAGSDAVGSQAVITSRSCIVCLFTSHSPPTRPFAYSQPKPTDWHRLTAGRATLLAGEGGETVNSGGGGSGGCGSGGQTRFEGQDYDFVFTVDVEEGKPPLKLPYNRTEDPWFAAQRFIDKHLLRRPTWIRTNAGETPTISQGTYADPYTGSGRYIPGSGTSDGGTGGGFSDPFTGGNRYVPGGAGVGGGASGGRGVTPELKAKYLPYKELQILSAGNMAGLRKKLGELAASVPADLPDRLGALLDFAKENAGWQTAVSSALCNLSQLVQQQAECPESSADRLLELLHRMLAKSWLGTERRARISRGCVVLETCLLTRPGSAVRAKDLGLKPLLHRFTRYQPIL
uniref:PFU domain-containing protein n=1 Tax=Macrostomum lignano TaxID=282301 RepID=A0A1I8FQA9_9PLAT